MRFTISLLELQKNIALVLPAIPPKSTLYVLEHISVSLSDGTLTLVATDQELTITTSVSVVSTEDGNVLVPARKLNEIIKALGTEGDLEFTAHPTNYEVTLRTRFGEYKIKGMNSEEYPNIPEFPQGTSTTLTRSDMQRIANKTTFAVSTEEYRPSMTGVYFEFKGEALITVATDGYRLVRVTTPASNGAFPDGLSVIVPSKAIGLLSKAESDVVMAVNKTHVQFIMASTRIVSRLIDEKFPAYENVIPKDNNLFCTFRQPELLSAIRRASIFTSSTSPQIRFAISKHGINVSAEDNESGNKAHETVPCEFESDDMEIGFNYRYFEEALQHINSDDTVESQIQMSLSTPTRAVLLRPNTDADTLLMLVMPMRIS
ncbi:MAG: DNA polymerase III subunit beta [Candidatus Kapabacteria bacterium]|nr:DNA polymerase III subunit beta [Candidatus Kapabacteria bacterium]